MLWILWNFSETLFIEHLWVTASISSSPLTLNLDIACFSVLLILSSKYFLTTFYKYSLKKIYCDIKNVIDTPFFSSKVLSVAYSSNFVVMILCMEVGEKLNIFASIHLLNISSYAEIKLLHINPFRQWVQLNIKNFKNKVCIKMASNLLYIFILKQSFKPFKMSVKWAALKRK